MCMRCEADLRCSHIVTATTYTDLVRCVADPERHMQIRMFPACGNDMFVSGQTDRRTAVVIAGLQVTRDSLTDV